MWGTGRHVRAKPPWRQEMRQEMPDGVVQLATWRREAAVRRSVGHPAEGLGCVLRCGQLQAVPLYMLVLGVHGMQDRGRLGACLGACRLR